MYNFSLSSSQKSLCRSSLRHGILCGDCRQKNGTLISLGRLDCYNCYSTLNSTIFATRPKRHRQLLHECFASKTSSWSLYCYRNILSTNINGNKREFSQQNWQGLKMCYVRCKWSREVESCKKQTTVYRRRVRHSHFNFSQMMMMMMILGQMSFIPPPHPYIHICTSWKLFSAHMKDIAHPKSFCKKLEM